MRLIFLFALLMYHLGHGQIPVIFHEKFDNNTYGWYEGKSPEFAIAVSEGRYVIDVMQGSRVITIAPYVDPGKPFAIQASFRQVSGLEDNGFGLAWGHDGGGVMNSFTVTSNGFYRIAASDTSLRIPGAWVSSNLIKKTGESNVLKVEQKDRNLFYYINGQLVNKTVLFPWKGKQLGAVVFTKMKVEMDDFIFFHDIQINLPRAIYVTGPKENMGPQINTPYDEVSPKISADGKTLYFGRKNSPENVGGTQDKEDIWISAMRSDGTWSKSVNMGSPINNESTNNLLSVSTDNNTLLFHTKNGFGVMTREDYGWSSVKDLGISFENESQFLEGALSADGKAIIFAAKLKSNRFYRPQVDERDIYVCEKKPNGTWSDPIHTGRILNTPGDEYSPFLSADGKTLYFATDGRAGYGDVDVFMAKRIGDGWTRWTEPVNLGRGINSVGFDAYYTLPASGEYGYMVSNVQSYGLTDIVRFKLPKNLQPDPVLLVSGKVLNAKSKKPVRAAIRFDDMATSREMGEANSDPATGAYQIVLPAGKRYAFRAEAPGYLSLNENLELITLGEYNELRRDLFLIPIEVGESIELRNVFFVQSKADLKSDSYPELDRLVQILRSNETMEIELQGHTDNLGKPEDNLKLSEERVWAVKKYLVSRGIQAARITGKGFGGSRPVAPSDTEANRQLNRRVEFKITRK